MLYVQQLGVTIYPKQFFCARYDRWWHQKTNHNGTTIDIYQANYRGIPKTIQRNEKRFCRIMQEMFDEYVRQYGRPDVLHAQAVLWAGAAAMQISERTQIPYYITEHLSHGCYDNNFGAGWTHDLWAKQLLTDSYNHASCVIPVADELLSDIAPYFGNDFRHRAVSNITDTRFFTYKERTPVGERPFRFCCLAIANGSFFNLKGYDTLAQAFARLEGCELHIAGRDTSSTRFRSLFEQHYGKALGQNVILHGDLQREAVRDLLHHCDALVLASRSEVQPLVVMEALSTGIPVVGTEVIPQSERIPGAVLIAPIGNAEILAQKMTEVQHIKPSRTFAESIDRLSSAQAVAKELTEIFSTMR